MPVALDAVRKSDLISQGGNTYTAKWPSNADTVLSIQPNGDWEVRPAGTAGAWERAELVGDKLVYSVGGHTYVVLVA